MSTAVRTYYRGHRLAVLRDGVSNSSRFYHFDHQGTTQALTDSGSAVTDRFASDAWGTRLNPTALSSSANPLLYVGGSGYYSRPELPTYARARHYAAPQGRWLSPDPVDELTPWMSVFSYVRNRPSVRIDATGLVDSPPGDPGGKLELWCCELERRGAKMTCDEICRDGQTLFKKGEVSGVICYSTHKCPCINTTTDQSVTSACPQVGDCALRHERKHFDDVNCDRCQGLHKPPFKFPWWDLQRLKKMVQAECDSYRETMDCLMNIKVVGPPFPGVPQPNPKPGSPVVQGTNCRAEYFVMVNSAHQILQTCCHPVNTSPACRALLGF